MRITSSSSGSLAINILLRDDKTYPYIKLTAERFPRVYVTRRLKKDGSTYFGPYFPGNLAHRLVHFIHQALQSAFLQRGPDAQSYASVPGVSYPPLSGPCVEGLTTQDHYDLAVRDVRLFLEGRHKDLAQELRARVEAASGLMRFEEAAALHELLRTVEELGEKQKMAAAEGSDTDILAYYAEPPLVAANLFHLRHGHIVDRREFFWEDVPQFEPAEFFSALLKQIYLNEPYVPAEIHVPVEFEDREVLEEFLSERRGRKVEIHTPQRGQKKAMMALVETNAHHSFDQRFRVMRPSSAAIQEALRDALSLEKAPGRIECFDISHIQGTDKVASMVVWEKGRMKKADYRKFIIRTVEGNDDFASMSEVITRRYSRLQEEGVGEAGPGAGGRRTGAIARGGAGSGSVGNYRSGAGVDRKTGRVDLRVRAGRRAGGAGQILTGVASGATGARRSAPVRGDLSSHAAQCQPPGKRAEADSWCGREDDDETAAAFREPGESARKPPMRRCGK